MTPRIFPSFHIGQRIADHPTCREVQAVLSSGTPQHSWLWLPAGAPLSQIVRTIVDLGNQSASQRELLLNVEVYFQEIFQPHSLGGDTSLVRDHKDFVSGAIQRGHCFHRTGDKLHLTPGSDVVPFRRFVVNDPVSVKKDGSS